MVSFRINFQFLITRGQCWKELRHKQTWDRGGTFHSLLPVTDQRRQDGSIYWDSSCKLGMEVSKDQRDSFTTNFVLHFTTKHSLRTHCWDSLCLHLEEMNLKTGVIQKRQPAPHQKIIFIIKSCLPHDQNRKILWTTKRVFHLWALGLGYLNQSRSKPSLDFSCSCRQMWYMYRCCGSGPAGSPTSPDGPHKAMMTEEENLRSVGAVRKIKMGTALPLPTTKGQCLLLMILV